MIHNSSRKQFFAKLLGVVAATSVFPKLFGKSASSTVPASVTGNGMRKFELRHDSRAVARRDQA